MLTLLLYIGLAMVVAHVGVPLVYYVLIYMVASRRDWDTVVNRNYIPKVSVVVPTFNERDVIEEKLNNIYSQNYPHDKLEIIVADSSDDGTDQVVDRWASSHVDVSVKLLKLPRQGKVRALNEALKIADGDVVVLTDADCLWTSDSLANAVAWLGSRDVGVVSCLKKPLSSEPVENAYRSLYNILRVGESKLHSTVVFHGELFAIKRDVLNAAGGFPINIGGDDTYMGIRAASMGYRSIVPDNVVCMEYVPGRGYFRWRLRRSQHLIQGLVSTLSLRKPRRYLPIYITEVYIHLVNPWLLPASIILLAASGSVIGYVLLAVGVVALAWPPFRAWVFNQVILMYSSLRNMWNRELVWPKVPKA